MPKLLEQHIPVVRESGLNTNKTVAIGGSANLDMSGSTGSFVGPTGGMTGLAPIISGSGATVTLTAAQSGSTVLLDRAAGIVFTLPAPTVGTRFTFRAKTSVTTNNYKVITNVGTVFLIGSIVNVKTDLTTLFSIADGSTIVAITMNGTTTGGLVGTELTMTCVSATQWLIQGSNLASGSIATPFATS